MEQVWQIMFYLLSSQLHHCDFTDSSFNHSQLSIFVSFFFLKLSFSTFHQGVAPTHATWSTIPTTNNGGSELGRPGYMGFYTSVIAMNNYVKNFPRISHQKQKSLRCNSKISSLYFKFTFPFHIIDEEKYTLTTMLQTLDRQNVSGRYSNNLFSIVSSHIMLLIHSEML